MKLLVVLYASDVFLNARKVSFILTQNRKILKYPLFQFYKWKPEAWELRWLAKFTKLSDVFFKLPSIWGTWAF